MNLGCEIVKKALLEPLRQITINSGVDAEKIIEELKTKDKNIGYDALKEQFVNMIKEGIIDPAKVTRVAVQNAISASAILITTEVAIASEKEEIK